MSEPQEAQQEEKAHHLKNGAGFVNPWESAKASIGLWSGMKLMSNFVPSLFTTHKDIVKVRPLDMDKLGKPPADKIQATWLGHAAFLIQMGGVNILTDPVFSDRCSPSQYAGPKRISELPPGIDNLPKIDAVIISHNHYDHLDEATVLKLGTDPIYYVPLGVKAWFDGFKNEKFKVFEFDWWQGGAQIPGLKVTCTPCQHASNRGVLDRNKTLWSSWIIQTTNKKKNLTFFFGGDTGYCAVPDAPEYEKSHGSLPVCPAFKEIQVKFPSIDFACLPIGAYSPRSFMSFMHCSPEDALNVHIDIKSKKSIGMHWGTWILTIEDPSEPPKRLKEACIEKGIPVDEFSVCEIGETVLS